MFLLPLYIGLASSGIEYSLRPIVSKITNYKSIIFATLAITISFWLSFNVIRSQSVRYSDSTGEARDAEIITTFLKNYLKPGDRVLSKCSLNYPLLYYFNLHGVPSVYLSSDLHSVHRILVVVHECGSVVHPCGHQTLRGILDEVGIRDISLSLPKIIHSYECATLYEISRGK